MTLLHPPLTGFPFVLLSCAVVSELCFLILGTDFWKRNARVFFYTACIAAPFTYLTGYIGSEYANQSFEVPDEVIASHQSAALIFVLALYTTLLLDALARVSSNRMLDLLKRAGLLTAFILCIWTSYQGGQLVFSHGAAVSISEQSNQE